VQGAAQGGANAGLGGPRLHNGQSSGVSLHGSCLWHRLSGWPTAEKSAVRAAPSSLSSSAKFLEIYCNEKARS